MNEKLKNNSLLAALALLVCCMLLAAVYYLPVLWTGFWQIPDTKGPTVFLIYCIVLCVLLCGLAGVLGWQFAKHAPQRGLLAFHLALVLLMIAVVNLIWWSKYVEAFLYIIGGIRPVYTAPLWRQMIAWASVHPYALCSYGVSMGVYALRSRKFRKQVNKKRSTTT